MISISELIFRPTIFLKGLNNLSKAQSLLTSLLGLIVYIFILAIPYAIIVTKLLPESMGIPFKVMSLRLFAVTVLWYPFTILSSCFFIWLFSTLLKTGKDLDNYIKLTIALGANQVLVFIPFVGRLSWALHSTYVYYLYFKEKVSKRDKYFTLLLLWLVAAIALVGLYGYLARIISLSFVSAVENNI